MSKGDEELDETLKFFEFSYQRDAEFDGTIVFEFEPESECQTKRISTVHVKKGRSCKVEDGYPADPSNVSCKLTLRRSDFLGIYSGKISARSAILAGRIKVHGWRFGEVLNFSQCFSFEKKTWDDFYEWKDSKSTKSSPSIPSSIWRWTKSALSSLTFDFSQWTSSDFGIFQTAYATPELRSMHLSQSVLTQALVERSALNGVNQWTNPPDSQKEEIPSLSSVKEKITYEFRRRQQSMVDDCKRKVDQLEEKANTLLDRINDREPSFSTVDMVMMLSL